MSFGARSIAKDFRSRSGPIKQKIRGYDVIIDSGAGDSFTDIYGPKRLATMLYAQRTIFAEEIPIAMGPQTIGPFEGRVSRLAARRSLKRMTAVLTRDSASHEYAARLGRTDANLTTDVVFALPREHVAKTRDVIINVSGLLWFTDKHLSSERYRELVTDFARQVLSQGRTVTLLAHVANAVSIVDDVAAIAELSRLLPNEVEVVIPESLTQIREVVGSAQVVIGSRMHACLNALSMGTPSIPWAYSRKFEPLMNDLTWAHGYDLRRDSDIVHSTLEDLTRASSQDWVSEVDQMLRHADERLEVGVSTLRGIYSAT